MNLIDSSYVPEIIARLFKEGLGIYRDYSRENLTFNESIEEIVNWGDRLFRFYENRGWNPKPIESKELINYYF